MDFADSRELTPWLSDRLPSISAALAVASPTHRPRLAGAGKAHLFPSPCSRTSHCVFEISQVAIVYTAPPKLVNTINQGLIPHGWAYSTPGDLGQVP